MWEPSVGPPLGPPHAPPQVFPNGVDTVRAMLRAPQAEDYPDFKATFASYRSRFMGGPLNAYETWMLYAAEIGHWEIRGFGMWMVHLRDTEARTRLLAKLSDDRAHVPLRAAKRAIRKWRSRGPTCRFSHCTSEGSGSTSKPLEFKSDVAIKVEEENVPAKQTALGAAMGLQTKKIGVDEAHLPVFLHTLVKAS